MYAALPLLILAGVPYDSWDYHKPRFRPSFEGWAVRIIPSQNRKHGKRDDLSKCWKHVLVEADRASEHGVHILAFHWREDERSTFVSDIYARHRLVWLDRSSLRSYGRKEFLDYLNKVVSFEESWRRELRPRDVRGAPILPETSFTTSGQHRQMWRRCDRVGIEVDDVEEVSKLITGFRQRHYARGLCTDQPQRVFDPGGARHGRASRRLRWKYTYLVPEGFHYDVSHSSGRPFDIRCADGIVHRVTKYANVDCHGHIW